MYPVLFHKAPHEEINFSMQNNAIEISCKEICAEIPTSAVNVTLPAFAAERGACCTARLQAAAGTRCWRLRLSLAQQQTRRCRCRLV